MHTNVHQQDAELPAVDVMKIFEKASDDRLGLPSALHAVLESLTCSCTPA